MHQRWRIVAFGLTVLLGACGAGEDATSLSGGAAGDSSQPWANRLFGTDVGEPSADASPSSDASPSQSPDAEGPRTGDGACLDADCAAPAAELCPGGLGCACDAASDCDSGFCQETRAGRQCMGACLETCPTGQQCVQTTLASGDVVFACVAPDARLCAPCASSEACNVPGATQARCLPQPDGSSVCGSPCVVDADCPTQHACRTVADVAGQTSQQCVPIDASGLRVACTCTANAVALGSQGPCYGSTQGEDGPLQCPGQQQCEQAGAAPVCNAQSPGPELCNGADDDCDGAVDESACDDGNACTIDACDPGKGCTTQALADGTPCDADGSVCTPEDACAGGACKVGAPLDCDDGNPCTQSACDLALGCTQVQLAGAPCSDGNACSVGDTCAGGACVPGPAKTCLAPGTCKVVACDGATGECVVSAQPDGIACDDGDACSAGETCAAGLCLGTPLVCQDNNPCTNDGCDPAQGCTHAPNTQPCDDSNACTGPDACAGGSCTSTPVTCDDGNPCTTDGCDPTSGCTQVAVTDKSPCGGASTWCIAGQCVPKAPMGQACVGAGDCASGFCVDGVCCESSCAAGCESCAGSKTGSTDGQCKPVLAGTDPDNDCTAMPPATCGFTGQCDGKGSCAKHPIGMPCSDAACADDTTLQQGGVCGASGCVAGALVTCDDGNACTKGDVCKAGSCLPGVQQDCNDGNACTDDSCAAVKGCIHTANNAPCEDGNVCTQDDACFGGSCKPGLGKSCNDDNPCTDDACDFQKGCIGIPNSKPCDDGDACTVGDACAGSACKAGSAKDCSDGIACTVDTCSGGTCSHDAKGCCTPKTAIANFDGATSGWAFSNSAGAGKGWQIRKDAKQTKSAPGALYYGDPAVWSYDFGVSSGTATSPPIAIPAGAKTTMSLWVFPGVESSLNYDKLTLSVLVNGAAKEVWKRTTNGAWVNVQFDTSGYAGSTLRLLFAFDTVDSVLNATQGVFVDDIEIIQTCP